MSNKCKICSKSVYPMDPQINLDGSILHTVCAKCADCKCQITLSNFTKNENSDGSTLLLCKTHYFKRFREQGSYVGGDKFKGPSGGSASSSPRAEDSVCKICSRSVYPMDRQINLDGSLFHQVCAKCTDCNCQITLSNFTKKENPDKSVMLLCKTHYFKRFHEQGSYVGGEKFKGTTGSSTPVAPRSDDQVCKICSRTVYPMDPQINLDGSLFHQTCAKCKDCNCQISLSNFHKTENPDKSVLLLCLTHYSVRSGLGTTGLKASVVAGQREDVVTPEQTSVWAGVKLRRTSVSIPSTPSKTEGADIPPPAPAPVPTPASTGERTVEPTVESVTDSITETSLESAVESSTNAIVAEISFAPADVSSPQQKAARYSSFVQDPSLEILLESVPIPEAGPGQVVVKVHVAAINPVDSLVCKGFMTAAGWKANVPFTPGYDFAGTVHSAGDGVTGRSEGDSVFAVNWGQNNHNVDSHPEAGAFSEYILISPSLLSRIPEGVVFEQAAAIALVGTTAYQCLDKLSVGRGSKVLILGGSSAVGAVAIQLAKLRGAFVAATCSSRSYEYASQWGADLLIDYTASRWDDHDEVKEFDAVFDAVGEEDGFARAQKEGLMKTDGSFVSISKFDAGLDPTAHAPLQFAAFYCLCHNLAVQDELARLLADGSLKVPIEGRYPFTQEGLSAIFQKQEGGKSLGKNVLQVV